MLAKNIFSGFSKVVLVCGMVFLPLSLSWSGTALRYSTYLGGTNGYDYGIGVVVDTAGMIYVGGTAGSSDFPTTAGSFSTTYHGSYDIYVCKINPSLSGTSSLIYCTLIGGSNEEYDGNIALDSTGRVYMGGYSYSTDFPITPNAYETTFRGVEDGVVSILNSTGSALVYSTYIGSTASILAYNISLDTAGNAYITGYTNSPDFPITPNALDSVYQGGNAAFALKLNPTLSGKSSLVYATFLAGSGDANEGEENYVDVAGNHYIGGYTNSTNFPVTANGYQTTNHGVYNAFLSKINPTGTALLYSTYLGGSLDDFAIGMTADNNGNAYLTGYESSSVDFPVTPNAYSTTYHGGDYDAFIAKFNTNTSGNVSLVYSTLIGGSEIDYGWGIAADSAGNAYFEGFTLSTDFPTTSNAYNTTYHGGYDIFVGKLNNSGSSLAYSTLLGGEGDEEAFTIAVDTGGNVYITGYSTSTDYPTTPSAYQPNYSGSGYWDSIITKLNIPNNVAVEDWDRYAIEDEETGLH